MNKKLKNSHWTKLFAAFKFIYETASSSGNLTINNHLEDLIHGLSKTMENLTIQKKEPEKKPVCAFLQQAIHNGMEFSEAPLLKCIADVKKLLTWQYGYEDEMPEDLKQKYAYSEIIGPHGNIYSEHLITGFVLLGPACYYPKHKHTDIEESYVCLSGEVSVNNTGIFKPESIVYIPPATTHELTTGKIYPCLLAYAWMAEPEVLNNFRMTLE